MVSLFIFLTGPTALDSEPRGRRYVKNMGHNRNRLYSRPSILLLVWRSIMFNGSILRVCRILQFVKKLDFAFLSLGGPSHGARVWCLGQVPKHRNHWQEVEGLLFSPKNSQLVHILSFHSVWFPYSSFQQVRQPSIPSPVEDDTPKIRDTTGTVFIQGHPLSCQYADALCSMIPT